MALPTVINPSVWEEVTDAVAMAKCKQTRRDNKDGEDPPDRNDNGESGAANESRPGSKRRSPCQLTRSA